MKENFDHFEIFFRLLTFSLERVPLKTLHVPVTLSGEQASKSNFVPYSFMVIENSNFVCLQIPILVQFGNLK